MGDVRRIEILCWALLVVGCAGERAAEPAPWQGTFHPPPKPGASITNTKQCECRACDPDSCCQAEQTESTAAPAADCNSSFEFPEHCGITVQTCTPRCYSHVWRIGNGESCEFTKPLVCCN